MIDVERTILEYEISLYHKEIATLRAQVETLELELSKALLKCSLLDFIGASARNAALEEAAKVAEKHPDSFGRTISIAIRALIRKE